LFLAFSGIRSLSSSTYGLQLDVQELAAKRSWARAARVAQATFSRQHAAAYKAKEPSSISNVPTAGTDFVQPAAQWLKPGQIGGVKRVRGDEEARHASLQDFTEGPEKALQQNLVSAAPLSGGTHVADIR
jgi:hypothetical protein